MVGERGSGRSGRGGGAAWRAVTCLALDVDGVLTDGRIYVDDDGRDLKAFDAHDGAGIAYLRMSGLRTALLSGRRSRAVRHRARELKIDVVIQQAIPQKSDALDRLLRRLRVSADEICYLGDDLGDLPVLRRVGLPVAVANARPEVKRCAAYVTRARGGRGAVREIAERILKAQGKWDAILARYQPPAGARAPRSSPRDRA